MQYATALVAALASMASATVFLGTRTGVDGSRDKVAYSLSPSLTRKPRRTNGTPDSCSGFAKIYPADQNPCGRDFFVDGGNGPFTFQGCGGNGLSLERGHTFNSNCKSQSKTLNCGGGSKIQQEWSCS